MVSDQVKNLISLSDELAECYNNTQLLGQLVFPEQFFAPMTGLHDQLFDFIDKCKAKKKVIAATRGIGKTSTAELLCKKHILYQDKRFIGYLSNSATSAELITENIKLDLSTNAFVKRLFGDVKESKVSGIDEKWAKTSWVANGYTIVLPRGAGQQVRGLKWINYRPDFWVIDDLEDDQEIENEVQREKLRKWFFGSLMYTVNQFEKYGQSYEIIYIDTIKHEDALITYLLEDPDWEHLTISICDDDYQTKAPEFVSQKTLNKEIDGHRARHTMDVFARERQCLPTSKEAAAFKASYFQYYSETDQEIQDEMKDWINVLLYDPSKKKDPKNAQTAFIVYGIDFLRNKFHVRLAKGDYLNVNEQYSELIRLLKQYNVLVWGVEVTGLEEHITYPLKNELIRQGLHKWASTSSMIELKARTGKDELSGFEGGKDGRIRSLLPYYERGLIFHNKVGTGALEQQLLSFPRSKLKDVSDAAAYLNQILEKGMRYMSPYIKGSTFDEDSIYDDLDKLVPLTRQVFM